MQERSRLMGGVAALAFLLGLQACTNEPSPAYGPAPTDNQTPGISANPPTVSMPGQAAPPIQTAGVGAGQPPQTGLMSPPVMGSTTQFQPPGMSSPMLGMQSAPPSVVAGDPQTFCAVKQVLSDGCSRCHGATPAFGAPMPLVTHADLMANTPTDGRPAYMVMLDRIKDTVRPMPPPPNDTLTAAQQSALEAWAAAGTPDNPNCAAPMMTPAQTANADCPDCGEYYCDPSKGKPVQILAHGQPRAGDTTEYDASSVGADGFPDLYQCFHFKAPWATGAQGLGHRPIIDNTRVLHHWLLYASDAPPPGMQDGGMTDHCQAQGDPNRVLLAGWAPGTPALMLPNGVGQHLPSGPNAYVTLEIHYYNTQPGMPADDRSGVELCIANEPQANESEQHWLGTEKIAVAPGATADAGDTCTPGLTASQTATIINVTPHMHKIGTHSKLEVMRANGTAETILDKPFQFDNQTTHIIDPPVVVHAGDRLRATCTYRNTTAATVAYGEGSDEEMCYLFTSAYPAGSLHNGKTGCALGVCVPGGIARCIDNENLLDAIGAL